MGGGPFSCNVLAIWESGNYGITMKDHRIRQLLGGDHPKEVMIVGSAGFELEEPKID